MNDWLNIKLILLLIVCIIAVITDLKDRKVYNWLTLPGLVLGIVINTLEQGGPGAGSAIIGLLAGGAIFFPAYFFGGMGAGDIKLMAVVGAFTGWFFVLNAALYTALAGGLMAIIVLVIKGQLIKTLSTIIRFLRSLIIPKLAVEPAVSENTFPYALAIAAGVVCTHWLPPLISF